MTDHHATEQRSFHWLEAKRNQECPICGAWIVRGDRITWNHVTKAIRCNACSHELFGGRPSDKERRACGN